MGKGSLIAILISVALAVLVSSVVVSASLTERDKDIKLLKSSVESQSTTLGELSDILGDVVSGNEELELRLADSELARRAAEQQVAENTSVFENQLTSLQSEIEANKKAVGPSITEIIGAWSPRVVKLECKTGRERSRGSGTYVTRSGVPSILTNFHVIDDNDDDFADECTIFFESGVEKVSARSTFSVSESKEDLGYIDISGTPNLPTSSGLGICSDEPFVGDELVILGYPSVGSKESATATEGIVSGTDKGFYITSAKIEQGNSGGAAIHVKNNCLLGIPTLTVVGEAESLARILPL